MKHKYKEGQVVLYIPSGERTPRKAAIETAYDDKNGSPVYDLDNGHWCYEEQIRRILKS